MACLRARNASRASGTSPCASMLKLALASMLTLSRAERTALERQAQADLGSSAAARRARLVLLLADGCSWTQIRQRMGCSDSFIARWSKRFASERLAGLYARHTGRDRYKLTDKLERRILKQTLEQTPADGSRHWSSRKLAAELGGSISHMTVARIWARHGIKPDRLESHPRPAEPAFNASAVDIVGLYLNRPLHAAIFRVPESVPARDESSGAGVSLVQPRPGLLALRRALQEQGAADTATRARRSGAAELAAFVASIAAQYPDGRETHVVADNATATRRSHLLTTIDAHPDVHLHLASTYSAWIGQMDRIVGKIEMALVALGPSRVPLGIKTRIMRSIRNCNQRPALVKWSYCGDAPDARRLGRHSPG